MLAHTKYIEAKRAQKGRGNYDKRNNRDREIVQHTVPPDKSRDPTLTSPNLLHSSAPPGENVSLRHLPK